MTWSEGARKAAEAANYYRNLARVRKAMTCRIEMYRKLSRDPKPIPRSCPKCGLGPCKQELAISYTGQGYDITMPSGQVDSFDNYGKPLGSKGAVGTTGHNMPTEEERKAELAENARQLKLAQEDLREKEYYEAVERGEAPPIPASILIKRGEEASESMKRKLAEEAEARKQAANPKAVATGDLGLPSGDKLRGNPVSYTNVPMQRRLKLIGYLADNFDQRGTYTIHDLDGMVDKIAAILLDD